MSSFDAAGYTTNLGIDNLYLANSRLCERSLLGHKTGLGY
jgi:hypothetical protein